MPSNRLRACVVKPVCYLTCYPPCTCCRKRVNGVKSLSLACPTSELGKFPTPSWNHHPLPKNCFIPFRWNLPSETIVWKIMWERWSCIKFNKPTRLYWCIDVRLVSSLRCESDWIPSPTSDSHCLLVGAKTTLWRHIQCRNRATSLQTIRMSSYYI